MKQFIILSYLVFGFIFSYGQNYQKLLRHNVIWDVEYWSIGSWDYWPCSTYEIRRYFLRGEKTINDTIYQEIVYQEIKAPTVICDGPHLYLDTTSTYLFAYVREDTTSQKVYKYFNECNKEKLLYDFSLQKGDTFKIYNNSCDSASLSIDDTLQYTLLDGTNVKEIENNTYYSEHHPYAYLESIGNLYEPFDFVFYRDDGFEGGSDLVGVIDNGILKFGQKVITDIPYIIRANQIIIYPNPAVDKLNIQFDKSDKINNIFITNILGDILDIKSTLTRDNLVEFNLTGLPTGIYFVAIQGELITYYKFIKYK
jgi:hypothetical protein